MLPVRSLLSGHYGNPSVNIAFTVGGVTCYIVKLTYEIIIINIVDIGIIGFLQINPTQEIMSGQIKNVSLFFESVHFKFIFAKFLKSFFIHTSAFNRQIAGIHISTIAEGIILSECGRE